MSIEYLLHPPEVWLAARFTPLFTISRLSVIHVLVYVPSSCECCVKGPWYDYRCSPRWPVVKELSLWVTFRRYDE